MYLLKAKVNTKLVIDCTFIYSVLDTVYKYQY